jgi:hypothetical protein
MANAEQIPSNGEAATKKRTVQNVYISASGKEAPSPMPDVVKIVKRFLDADTGEVSREEELDLRNLSQQVLLQGAAFGLHQVAQNAYGAAKDTDEKAESCASRWEDISNGSWRSDRQVGPRTSDLILAYARVFEQTKGKAPSDAWVERQKAKLAEGVWGEGGKHMLADPAIKAAIDAIKAERAIEKSKKSAEKAGTSSSLDFDDEDETE